MTSSWLTPVLTGVFGISGVLGGVLLTGLMSARLDDRKRAAEDKRRWLNDQRALYTKYLTLCEAMLREIDGVAVFLVDDESKAIPEDDEELIKEDLLKYQMRWDDQLQPLLEELRLIASPQVADLADRMSGALMELTGTIERRGLFGDHHPIWLMAQDLLAILRNSMRDELGVPRLPEGHAYPARDDNGWPWLEGQSEHRRAAG